MVRIWQLASATGKGYLGNHHPEGVTDVMFRPDSESFITTSVDGMARLWDIAPAIAIDPTMRLDAEPTYIYEHDFPLTSVAVNEDGTQFVTGSTDNNVYLWGVDSGNPLGSFSGHTDVINAVAYSPDFTKILTASDDNTAKLWDVESMEAIATLEGHTGAVNGIAFSIDGSMIATASDDGTARLWNVETGELLLTFAEHTDAVNDVAFTPDGTSILSVSTDTTVQSWNVETGEVERVFASPERRFTKSGHVRWHFSRWAACDNRDRWSRTALCVGYEPIWCRCYYPSFLRWASIPEDWFLCRHWFTQYWYYLGCGNRFLWWRIR